MMTRPTAKPPYRYSTELRAILLCVGFVSLLTVISIRLIHVQHTQHEDVMAEMKDETFLPEIVPARRGDIYDRDRRPLATTEPVSDLILNKHHVPFVERIHMIARKQLGMTNEELKGYGGDRSKALYYQMLASKLARPLKLETTALLDGFRRPKMNLVVAKGVDSQLAREIVKGLEHEGYAGILYRDSMRRAYVSDDLACHVLGYVYHGTEGAEGIEASMDGFLRGTDGARYYNLEGTLVDEEMPQHGRHVVLTLDAAFQDMTEKIVDKHFKALRADSITVIFAEPSSGEILALVNRPGFKPSDAGNSKPRSRWNRAASAVYEPGSTFKIVTLGAALDLGLVGLDSWVSCHNGYYREDGWEKALEDSAAPRESASVRDVLAYSLNTGTFMVAQQMKAHDYYSYMLKFGFGTKTGIRLPAEAGGKVPHPMKGEVANANDGWSRNRMALSRLGMGYNLNATPLQVLGLMSVVCNHGNLVKPRIVREILTEDHKRVSASLDSEVVENVYSARTASKLKSALIHAVEEGTGKNARIDGYVVGGKTGTTMKIVGGGYRKNRNITSFLGFIGTESEPALIGMVLVDDPQSEGKRHGGSVAAPIFKEIAEAGMYHFGVRRLASTDVEMAN
ncbi:MAG: penicillin-binding protein 2 [Verrucomicrobiales bacterium]|nr:penicillin-binding protein 2 [Verrucomicrobiales bacterium]